MEEALEHIQKISLFCHHDRSSSGEAARVPWVKSSGGHSEVPQGKSWGVLLGRDAFTDGLDVSFAENNLVHNPSQTMNSHVEEFTCGRSALEREGWG